MVLKYLRSSKNVLGTSSFLSRHSIRWYPLLAEHINIRALDSYGRGVTVKGVAFPVQWETILKLCAEGGRKTLYGAKLDNETWLFSRSQNENTLRDFLTAEEQNSLQTCKIGRIPASKLVLLRDKFCKSNRKSAPQTGALFLSSHNLLLPANLCLTPHPIPSLPVASSSGPLEIYSS